MIRQWEITTRNHKGEYGSFRFCADSKVLAHDHAMTLRDDIDFTYLHGTPQVSRNLNERIRHIAVRFVGWIEA